MTADQSIAELASPDIFNRGTIAVTIRKAADADEGGGVEVFSTNSITNSIVAAFSTNSTNSPQNFSAFLTCDTYVIETLCSIELRKPYDNVTGFHQLIARFGYSSNTGTTSYKSLTPVLGCNYTTPIAGTDSMLNPTFGLPAGKKCCSAPGLKRLVAILPTACPAIRARIPIIR
ncbi:hypothetical protein [Paraflavitalea speifideaquila]|uniref:hypothetical protein n=1 Tax=Paraflavitalea speifideaquila TaxID=3076558 RepID=UPI0028ED372E|nr:hypothetical protein [Paraflavitalea speifideiaquila]